MRMVRILASLAVAIVAAFFGMFLPFPTDGALHNPVWELVFGLGWLTSSAFFGFLVWPVCVFAALWLLAFRVLGLGGRQRIIFGTLFVISLLPCVGRDLQNSIAVHVPLWSNEYFVRY